jgi:hypothetical protein
MKIIYQAQDGKNFKKEEDCIDYEKNNSLVYVLIRYIDERNKSKGIDDFSIHSTNEEATATMHSMMGPTIKTIDRMEKAIDFEIQERLVKLTPIGDIK